MDTTYNSNITSLYLSTHTFNEKYKQNLEKTLSIDIAKIDLILDDVPFPPDQLGNIYDQIYQLINEVILLAQTDRSVFPETVGSLSIKLNKIIKSLVLESFLVDFLQNIKHKEKVSITPSEWNKLEKVRALVGFSYGLMGDFPSNVKLATEMTIGLLRCLKSIQMELIKHNVTVRTRRLIADTLVISNVKRIYNPDSLHETSRHQDTYIDLENSDFINESIETVSKCISDLITKYPATLAVFQVYEDAFLADQSNRALLLSELVLLLMNYENGSKRNMNEVISILQSILVKMSACASFNKSNTNFRVILKMYEDLVKEDLFSTYIQSTKKTVIRKKRNTTDNVDSNDYRYHINREVKEPDWVKNFYTSNWTARDATESWNNSSCDRTPRITDSTTITNNEETIIEPEKSRNRNPWWKRIFKKSSRKGKTCKKCKFFPWHRKSHL